MRESRCGNCNAVFPLLNFFGIPEREVFCLNNREKNSDVLLLPSRIIGLRRTSDWVDFLDSVAHAFGSNSSSFESLERHVCV